MSNKQNTQFYWEIKDYLPNNNSTIDQPVKKSLKQTIVNIFEQNLTLPNTFTHDTELRKRTNNLLNNYSSKTNPFTLSENLKISAKRPSNTRINDIISSLKSNTQTTANDLTANASNDPQLDVFDMLDYSDINLNPLANVKNKNVVKGIQQSVSSNSGLNSRTVSNAMKPIQGLQQPSVPTLNPSINPSNTPTSNATKPSGTSLQKDTSTRGINLNPIKQNDDEINTSFSELARAFPTRKRPEKAVNAGWITKKEAKILYGRSAKAKGYL